MKSKFETLHCPCGCELGVSNSLEFVYSWLKDKGFEVYGVVNCANGRSELIAYKLGAHLRQEEKLMQALVETKRCNVTARYLRDLMRWQVKVDTVTKGVVYG